MQQKRPEVLASELAYVLGFEAQLSGLQRAGLAPADLIVETILAIGAFNHARESIIDSGCGTAAMFQKIEEIRKRIPDPYALLKDVVLREGSVYIAIAA